MAGIIARFNGSKTFKDVRSYVLVAHLNAYYRNSMPYGVFHSQKNITLRSIPAFMSCWSLIMLRLKVIHFQSDLRRYYTISVKAPRLPNSGPAIMATRTVAPN